MSKLTFISADDWEGIYLENNLIAQGHYITSYDLAQYLFVNHKGSINVDDLTSIEAGGWLYDEGYLPETLEEFMEKQNEQ